jgi:hypothetical protein
METATPNVEAGLNFQNPLVQQALDKRGDARLAPAFSLPKQMIWAPQYVIQASPLSKLFTAEWGKKCLKDPSLLTDPAATFEMRIPRNCGGIVMPHNSPLHVSTLLPQQNTREVVLDEITPLVHWLCGGEDGSTEETDIYGVVAIEVNVDMTAELITMLNKGFSAKKMQDRYEQMSKSIQGQIGVTRDKADARVKRALKATYNNLVAEWQRIKEKGGGVYAPSVSEALAAHILASEIKEHADTTQAAFDLIGKAMSKPLGGAF